MNRKEELSKKILEYLRKNQEAGDTLEGITKWWLESQRVDETVEEVAGALNMLLEKGLLIKISRRKGHEVYKLNNK